MREVSINASYFKRSRVRHAAISDLNKLKYYVFGGVLKWYTFVRIL